jgi:hypothetical protein
MAKIRRLWPGGSRNGDLDACYFANFRLLDFEQALKHNIDNTTPQPKCQ